MEMDHFVKSAFNAKIPFFCYTIIELLDRLYLDKYFLLFNELVLICLNLSVCVPQFNLVSHHMT